MWVEERWQEQKTEKIGLEQKEKLMRDEAREVGWALCAAINNLVLILRVPGSHWRVISGLWDMIRC